MGERLECESGRVEWINNETKHTVSALESDHTTY